MLWSGPDAATGKGLARLIGLRRTNVLVATADTATTTAIAALAGVPISSASEHLAALRAAGLVRSVRQGRQYCTRGHLSGTRWSPPNRPDPIDSVKTGGRR